MKSKNMAIIYQLLIILVIWFFSPTSVFADADKTGGYSQTTIVAVEASGPSIDDAKNNGFRMAIQEAVGSVIISEQSSLGDQLTKDQINEYSAGYIDHFEISERKKDDTGLWILKMKVRVASSKIALRMLSSSNQSSQIDGATLQSKLESQLATRNSGDNLLNEVLNSFPEIAFIINQGQTEVNVSKSRQAVITIPYQIKMSQFWVEGLDEALSLIAVDPIPDGCNRTLGTISKLLTDILKFAGPSGVVQKPFHPSKCNNEDTMEPDIRVSYAKTGSWLGVSHDYNLPDKVSLELINSHINPYVSKKRFSMKVEAFDDEDLLIATDCHSIPIESFITFINPKGVRNLNEGNIYFRPDINGKNSDNGTLLIHQTTSNIGEINKIQLSMTNECVASDFK